ncbi:MAG: ArsA family ATPase [Myxococcales bacterium]|nr:ArsA family ATPase [Myxococcales bacterium]
MIVTVGCGGVGKTTVAAAVALAAARKGRRVLCLTIDPAKRLATSLGLKEMRAEAQTVPPELWGQPESTGGALTAMMLDVRGTFDELVTRHASSPEVRDRILSNRIYREVAGNLAGTPEYMAMEKLHAVRDDPRYDLIVLDTPPTSNALDFLDAPDKMIDAMDSPAVKAFVTAFQRGGSLSLSFLSRAMAKVLQGLSTFTGGGFLEQIAEFLSDLQGLFGGFRERASKVRESLAARDVAFVLVTSTDPMAVGEAMFFAERLQQNGMVAEAVVMNRVRSLPEQAPPSADRLAGILGEAGVEPAQELGNAFSKSWRDAQVWARRDAQEVARVARDFAAVPRHVVVPALDEDVYDIAALTHVAACLV